MISSIKAFAPIVGRMPLVGRFHNNKNVKAMRIGYIELEMVSQMDFEQMMEDFTKSGCKFVFDAKQHWEKTFVPMYSKVCFYGEIPTQYESCVEDESGLDYYEHLEKEWKRRYAA